MKRFVDTLLVLVFSPLWLALAAVVALAVALRLGRPVFFTQVRAGLGERPFRLWKFRTMIPGVASDGERLTRFGRALRATSLDELPQLVHVLSGKMALVGPRPLPVAYLPRYTAAERRRHEVRPGITGWAQVNGRNAITWEEKFRLDVWYVDHRSLALDFKILLKTVYRAVRRDNVNAGANETMGELRPGVSA